MLTVRPLVPEDYPVVKEIVAEAFGADLPPDTQNLWSRPVDFRVCDGGQQPVAYIGVMERDGGAVLVPNARDRQQIVPDAPLTDVPTMQPAAVDTPQARPHRLSWAAVLARVFDSTFRLYRMQRAHAHHRKAPEAVLTAATSKASAVG